MVVVKINQRVKNNTGTYNHNNDGLIKYISKHFYCHIRERVIYR